MFDDVTHDVILPLGWAGSIFLAENESHIYPNNVCQIWLRSDGRVEKGGGVQTDRQRKLQLYIVDYTGLLYIYK